MPVKLCVEKIELEQAQKFIQENHIQGASYSDSPKESVGLFNNSDEHEQELIGVAQFCSPRTAAKKREYTTELLRLCFKKDVRVIGGASKLINHYIKKYNPADIFTYQDTTGENTDVYVHCGFTLVKQDKEKQYLVMPGKTLETADRKNKEVFTLATVVQRGPDALLGTKLGKVINALNW